jgi:hypothetical protein
MADTLPTAPSSDSRSPPAFEVVLSSSLVGLAELLPEGAYRTAARLLAPLFGYGLVALTRRAYREFQHWRFERLIAAKVVEWKAELCLPATTAERAADLRANLTKYETLLLRRQLDNVDVKED